MNKITKVEKDILKKLDENLVPHNLEGRYIPSIHILCEAFRRLPNPIRHPSTKFRVMIEDQAIGELNYSAGIHEYNCVARTYLEFEKINVDGHFE